MNFQLIREGMDNSINTRQMLMKKGYCSIRSEQPGTGMMTNRV